MIRARFILFLIFVFTYQTLESQKDIKFEFYSIRDGLSQSSITCIYQDSEGLIWIGTQDGLNLYDGYNFTIFRYQPFDTASISNNFINCIYEDRQERIWIGTNDGLNLYDKKSKEFRSFLMRSSKTKNFTGNPVYDIYQSSDDKLWIKTINATGTFNPETTEFNIIKLFNSVGNNSLGARFFSFFEDPKSRLWIGGDQGIHVLDLKENKVTRYSKNSYDLNSLSDNLIRDIKIDARGNIWIATANGLNKFVEEKGSFIQVFPARQDQFELGNDINFILSLDSVSIIVGTNKGLGKLNTVTNKFESQYHFELDSREFNEEEFTDGFLDHSNILWLGTGRGLLKYDLKPQKIKLINQAENPIEGIHDYDIASLFFDKYGVLWIGTWGSGLHFVKDNKSIAHYHSAADQSRFKISNDKVHKIVYTAQGEIWIGTQNGVEIFQERNERFVSICDQYQFIPCDFLEGHRIYDIVFRNSHECWIGTNRGIMVIDFLNKTTHRVISLNLNDTTRIHFNNVYAFETDSVDNVWLGTDNGLIYTDFAQDAYRFYKHYRNSGENTISSNDVFSLHIDMEGVLWVGTASGLNRYEHKTRSFDVYTERDGLPNNLIYDILEDDSGFLWLTTNRGLVRFDRKKEQFFNFDLMDGIQSYEYNLGASLKGPDNIMYFGGINGLNLVDPDSIPLNIIPPKTVITEILEIVGNEVRKVNISPDNSIHIGSKSGLTLRFAVTDYTYPEKNLYAYIIDEDSKSGEWIYIGNAHEAIFASLKPGTYHFRVKGSNNDNVWDDDGKALIINVSAPLWESNMAYTVYILILISLVYFFIKYRTRTLRELNKEYKEKQRASEKISRQKEELTVKNKNITDSINYAKRIQEAIMPSKAFFRKCLPQSFVLHIPKDIVSGDFYWIYEKGSKIFVAAVDCTGHGVPGAFMSIIGFELFRKITNSQGIEEPAKILNTLNSDFAEIFNDVTDFTLRDGMDIAFCVIDFENKKIEYSGAFNPFYLIRDNKINEIKGDRFSVGIEAQPDSSMGFTNHVLDIEKDDVVYIFSDGFADQFGGPEGKKFKYRRFRHLLLTIHKLPMELQHDMLKKSIDDWRGDMDQVDDILVIGFKPEK